MTAMKKMLSAVVAVAMIIGCVLISSTSFAAKGDHPTLNVKAVADNTVLTGKEGDEFKITLNVESVSVAGDMNNHEDSQMNSFVFAFEYPEDKVEVKSTDITAGNSKYFKNAASEIGTIVSTPGKKYLSMYAGGDGVADTEGPGELMSVTFKLKAGVTEGFSVKVSPAEPDGWSDSAACAPADASELDQFGTVADATLNFTIAKTVNDISIDNTELDMVVGGADKTLTATIDPLDADEQGLTWTSSNPEVATVTGPGTATDGKATATIKAFKAGTATITVTTKDGNKSKDCVVTVKENAVIENVEFDASLNIDATAKTGTKTLTGNFGTLDLNTLFKYKTDGADIVLDVAIADGTVLTLDGTVLSYKGIGKEDITVAVKAGPKAANAGDTLGTYTITVDVQALEISNDTVKDLTTESTTIKVGETTTIKNPAIDPAVTDDITKATFAYKSENTAVATVDPATGEVKGVAPGTAKIVCEVSYNDKVVATKEIEITVTAADAPATDDPQAPSGQTPGKAPGSTNTGDAGVALAASLSLAAAAAFVLAKKRED